jgi:hypothetical protein
MEKKRTITLAVKQHPDIERFFDFAERLVF